VRRSTLHAVRDEYFIPLQLAAFEQRIEKPSGMTNKWPALFVFNFPRSLTNQQDRRR
jgi:hypothetical protein